MAFSANMSAWQATSFLSMVFEDQLWERLSLLAAVLLPQGGLRFFQAFRGSELRRDSTMFRISAAIGVIAASLVLSPWHDTVAVHTLVLAQAAGLMYAGTFYLHRRTAKVESRVEATKVGYLVVGGAVAITFSVLDFLPSIGVVFPPIGTFLTLIFMYVLAQSLQRDRLLDIYELVGRLSVLLLMGMTLAAMFTAYFYWSELSGQFFLNGVVSALVVLILFDPLRSRVELWIHDFILRERLEFERQIAATRADLWHVFDLTQIGKVLMEGLDRTHRVTHSALYIMSNDGQRYHRINSLGLGIPPQLEYATVRPVLDGLDKEGVVNSAAIVRELEHRAGEGDETHASSAEVIIEVMHLLQADVILPISTDEVSLGLITFRDDRLTMEPYTLDDIVALKALASQVGVAVQNSHHYAKMKERDRLASLGEMAAGLAHEIRNPLGSIKGAAQLLEEERGVSDHEPPELDRDPASTTLEFLDVIIEETNRLNRVVSTFLDYARPFVGDLEPLQINDLIRRTVQAEEASQDHDVNFILDLTDNPPPVRADAEQLYQVFINLVRNAVQAMNRRGELKVSTLLREARSTRVGQAKIEIRFSDSGPGISSAALEKIFIPFFTTKPGGTGLGLPICQRIVQDMGGTIEVEHTSSELGTTFVVSLPVHDDDNDAVITTTGPFMLRT